MVMGVLKQSRIDLCLTKREMLKYVRNVKYKFVTIQIAQFWQQILLTAIPPWERIVVQSKKCAGERRDFVCKTLELYLISVSI